MHTPRRHAVRAAGLAGLVTLVTMTIVSPPDSDKTSEVPSSPPPPAESVALDTLLVATQLEPTRTEIDATTPEDGPYR